ncbi:hypothetical protein EBS02_10635 [bacterium]|nr:hypothetical protein [bacterium]
MIKNKKKKNPTEAVRQVTLPIGAKIMFKPIIDIAWAVQDNKDEIDKDEFYDHLFNELGVDGYLTSFTSEGHIGSGSNRYEVEDNPHTARIAKSFYKALDDIFGDDGSIPKMLSRNVSSPNVKKNRLFRFKGAIVNLVQLYCEAQLGFGTNARKKKTLKEGEIESTIYTAFDYKRRTTETDEEWYRYLISVQENRYARLFVATILFITLSDIFLIRMPDVKKTIDKRNMAGIKNIKGDNELDTLKKQFAQLKSVKNRKKFIQSIRKLWKLDLRSPQAGDQTEIDV